MRRALHLSALALLACGSTTPSPGADASVDAKADVSRDAANDTASDASVDAISTCPTLKPQRLQACPTLGELCLYGCGIAMRCTAKGWDDDLTVDAGPPCP